jgi:putative transposase
LDRLLELYKIKKSTYYGWLDEQGNLKPPIERKISNPRKILLSEIQAVLKYREIHKDVGYRKFCWQMIDENIAYLTESAVYDILSRHKMLYGWAAAEAEGTSKEYKNKPQYPHHHWHTDIAYIKIQGIFYFLIMMLDGYSRYLLGWELMTDMLGTSVESFVQKIKEKYPDAKPMLIHDNGGQFISLDFKKLVTALEIQSVRTRRNHPQTNGKIERMNGTVKSEAIRPGAPADYEEALEILNKYEYTYNHQRLHAGINFLRPADLFFGRKNKILRERDQKLATGLQLRKEFNRNESVRLN